jgi:amphi-Trp domain-containing protein
MGEKKKVEVEREASLSLPEAVAQLQELLAQLESDGVLVLEEGGERLELQPEGRLVLKVEGKLKPGKGAVSFKLKWHQRAADREPPAATPEPPES